MSADIVFVVKLGGSAITDKAQLETIKPAEIERAATVLYKCWKAGRKFVVVHGAGSFGHHQAKEYAVAVGHAHLTEGEEVTRVRKGFCLTRVSVCKLNAILTEKLVDAGLPAISQSACGAWVTKNREVVRHPCDQIGGLVSAGYVPVLHGDCVLDVQRGCTILSGDTICKVLCLEFLPPLCVFVSDVEGVYDKPPHLEDAALLPELVVSSDGTIRQVSTHTESYDVTGGIKGKLQAATDIVHKGQTNVVICGIGTQAFEKVCMGEDYSNLHATVMKLDNS